MTIFFYKREASAASAKSHSWTLMNLDCCLTFKVFILSLLQNLKVSFPWNQLIMTGWLSFHTFVIGRSHLLVACQIATSSLPLSSMLLLMPIVTEVPGMTDRGTGNDTWDVFYTAGMKCSRVPILEQCSRNVEHRGVPRSRWLCSCHRLFHWCCYLD